MNPQTKSPTSSTPSHAPGPWQLLHEAAGKDETQTPRVFVKFGSHRARDYAMRAIDRKPKAFFSLKRSTDHGVYEVTEQEAMQMRSYSSHARFTLLRKPYDDLMECW